MLSLPFFRKSRFLAMFKDRFFRRQGSGLFVVIFFVLYGWTAAWVFCGKAGFFDPGKERIFTDAKHDLLIVGSDPEGIAAALSGARNGLQTILVDHRFVPGGLMTLGWLNSIDMNYGPQQEILNKGIFFEFFQQIEGDSFDPETAAEVFRSLLDKEKNLVQMLGVQEIKPVLNQVGDKKSVEGVRVVLPSGQEKNILARRTVDATQDADLAAAAGVPYSVGLSDCGRPHEKIAATLIFKLKGVGEREWRNLWQAIAAHQEPHTGANSFSAWGFLKTMSAYKPMNDRLAVRGLNIGRLKEDGVLINALHIFGVDPLDPNSRKQARAIAEEEIPHLVRYLKKNIPGLENAEIGGVAPELYIRDSRHIQGLYRLSVNDIMENKDFWDRVAFGSYPVDIQATSLFFRGDVIGKPQKYAVPFRCLVPQGVENLLVVGRAASFDALAAGSARVIPVGMATGEAAGLAAALSIEKNLSFQRMAFSSEVIGEMQDRLNLQGMEIKPFQVPIPSGEHWAYPGLRFMRRWGLASGGYANDYRLDEEMKEESFLNGLSLVLKLNGTGGKGKVYPQGQKLTLNRVAQIICAFQGIELAGEQAYRHLAEKGFWDQVVLEHVWKEGKVSRGAGYMLIKRFVEEQRDHNNDGKECAKEIIEDNY